MDEQIRETGVHRRANQIETPPEKFRPLPATDPEGGVHAEHPSRELGDLFRGRNQPSSCRRAERPILNHGRADEAVIEDDGRAPPYAGRCQSVSQRPWQRAHMFEAPPVPTNEDRGEDQFDADVSQDPYRKAAGEREDNIAEEPDGNQATDDERCPEEANPLPKRILELGNRIGGADQSAPHAWEGHLPVLLIGEARTTAVPTPPP